MKIEKIIHYCWFGESEMSELEKQCILSWKDKLSDYKFILWNEENFDLDAHPFAKQAYDCKKYAFVSDYVRVYALYSLGGIYLDTDYEVIKPIDSLLNHGVFLGCENTDFIGTAIIGAVKGHWLLKEMLDYYDSVDFINTSGDIHAIPNTMILTDILECRGFKRGLEQQIGDILIHPINTFYPERLKDKSFDIKADTFGIHYFNGSWWSDKERKRSKSIIYTRIIRPVLRVGKKLIILMMGKDWARNIEVRIKNKLK